MTPKTKVEVTKPEVKPTATEPTPTTPQATEVKKPEEKQTKQQVAVMQLVVALRQQRQIEVKPEMLVQDGKFINFVLGETWPVIAVGPSGGMNLPQIKSYPKADLATMIKADELLAKQVAREQKKAATNTQTAPAAAKPEVREEAPKAAEQKKSKAS